MPDSNPNVVISSLGITKEFKDFWNRPKAKAVVDLDFEVYEGEVVGLLGPNGSGKSTTVKMLLGLLYPTSGELKVFDNSPRDVKSKKRIGYLPEESYLYKYLTAIETLDFFGALFNLSKKERLHRSEQLLDMVGLSHAKNRPVGEFSKGMQRRIGLAQAMINDPDLLILDEPTSGLDPIGCKEVKELILLLKSRGKTVLVTSHLLSDIEDVCDRVIILYGGKVRATGALNDLLRINDSSTITTSHLNPDETEKVINLLRENLKGDEFKIDNSKKSLESFFLEIVDQAKDESIETSGVVSGGEIAEYLSGDQAKTDILKQLVNEDTPDTLSELEPESELESEKIEKVLEKLDKLVEKEEVKVEETDKKEKEDFSDANEKLKDLLDG